MIRIVCLGDQSIAYINYCKGCEIKRRLPGLDSPDSRPAQDENRQRIEGQPFVCETFGNTPLLPPCRSTCRPALLALFPSASIQAPPDRSGRRRIEPDIPVSILFFNPGLRLAASLHCNAPSRRKNIFRCAAKGPAMRPAFKTAFLKTPATTDAARFPGPPNHGPASAATSFLHRSEPGKQALAAPPTACTRRHLVPKD